MANDTNPEISITGYVNAYIGGSIQTQGNGIGGLAYKTAVSGVTGTSGTGISVLDNNNSLTAGVYNNGAGLTSVGRTPLQTTDFSDLPANAIKNNLNPTINLFGGKEGGTGNYSSSIGPANVQVKLTLVSNSSNNPSGQN